MMVALPSILLVLSAGAQVAGPRPAVLAASPARTVEWLPSVRVAAWAQTPAVLLPSVLLPVAPAWVPAQGLSAARAVELPRSVLLAAWAQTPTVLLPMVPGLCPRRAHFSPMRRKFAEQLIAPSR
jgi:hypothetical protein